MLVTLFLSMLCLSLGTTSPLRPEAAKPLREPSRCALPGDDHIEQLFERIEPLVLGDRVNGGAGDEGALVLETIPHLDPERDFPGIGFIEPQAAFGAVARDKLLGAFEEDAVPAEIADDRCYLLRSVLYREGEVLPARVWNFMPLLFSIVDLQEAAASRRLKRHFLSMSTFYAKRSARTC